MNKALFFLCLVGGLSLPFPARAQSLVQFPSGNAAWQVGVTSNDPRISGAKVTVTRFGDVSHSTVFSKTINTNRWKLQKLGLSVVGFNNNVYAMPEGSPQLRFTEVACDEAAFTWLKGNMLTSKDPISYQGKQCFHYQATISIAQVDPLFAPIAPPKKTAAPLMVKCEAWIEKSTLLPVALQHPFALYSFTFLPPPEAPLQLPAAFQAELNRYEVASTPPRRLY